VTDSSRPDNRNSDRRTGLVIRTPSLFLKISCSLQINFSAFLAAPAPGISIRRAPEAACLGRISVMRKSSTETLDPELPVRIAVSRHSVWRG